ncbi:hypothetical protein DPX16_19317 [Anabarilius grahami]|uniref:Uncharacterized protein n=1 Tax=Anabarilius grahami TaxID=495550 RepID=A0A3N0Z1K4_ANAGA|nr:hypothetical protein DPX16_19317 [Anabarilius grahami]
MAYDMVVLRTSPDLAESLKSLEKEFLKCKDVICGPTDGQAKKLKTQLLQCNLTMCFTHPEEMACLQTDVETPTWLSRAQTMED